MRKKQADRRGGAPMGEWKGNVYTKGNLEFQKTGKRDLNGSDVVQVKTVFRTEGPNAAGNLYAQITEGGLPGSQKSRKDERGKEGIKTFGRGEKKKPRKKSIVVNIRLVAPEVGEKKGTSGGGKNKKPWNFEKNAPRHDPGKKQ